MRQIGTARYDKGDHEKAIEYWTKAAELGDATGHLKLGTRYNYGKGVEKDEEKAVYHWEEAAIGGHPIARQNLGYYERAVKHLIIAANLGYEESMKELWKFYSAGYITKEELESTLRTHNAAIDATKSAQRDAAEAYFRQLTASR